MPLRKREEVQKVLWRAGAGVAVRDVSRGAYDEVEIALADRLAQCRHEAGCIVVRSLDVHRLAVAAEHDVARAAPLAQVARTLREVRMRLRAQAAGGLDGAEHLCRAKTRS